MGRTGLEPVTYRLKGDYSKPIELTTQILVDMIGIEPILPCGSGLQSEHDPYVSTHPNLAVVDGLEPPTHRLTIYRSTTELNNQNYYLERSLRINIIISPRLFSPL